ncbi:MAG: L,D-transpeptidase family protein [Microcoleaceae cyanobacterium]
MSLPKKINTNQAYLISCLLLITAGISLYYLLVRLEYLFPLQQLPTMICRDQCLADQINLNNYPNHQKNISKWSVQANFNYDKSLKDILPKNQTNLADILIQVMKSQRQLIVYYQNKPVKSYPIVLGQNPVGDKQKQGDYKTPEGIFQVHDLYPHPEWSKFIWINYPTGVSWRKYWRAKLAGEINWHDGIGREIGIHGVPAGQDYLIDEKNDWTWGCISLKNQDVDELYEYLQKGTVINILP